MKRVKFRSFQKLHMKWETCPFVFLQSENQKRIMHKQIWLCVIERKCFFFIEHDFIFSEQPYMWMDRETCAAGLCQGHAYKQTQMFFLAHSCHSVTEMGLGAKRNTLACKSHSGQHSGRFTLARSVLSIHCRTESKYSFCLEIATRPQPYTHIQRERK